MASAERIAVITGGQGALARAIAAVLPSALYTVHTPGKAELDVRSPASVQKYFATLPQVDLLINNAGLREDALMLRNPEAAWNEVMDTNLKGVFLTSQAALKSMLRRRQGHILNVGSYAARSGPVGQANYAAAKAGLIGLTQSLAKEVGGRNIRVNCVLPGWMETKFTANVPSDKSAQALSEHVLGRFNSVSEAARAIAFLDTLENLSGQVIQLDSRISKWV
jgi:NAD(P)-dependent dehydrogenase (short-subunit alcohol dehydrogenase family)